MPPLRRRLAAAAALATLLPLTACGDEMPAIRTVPVGDIVEGRTPEQIADGKRSFLMLPVGRLDLRVGELLERIDDDETRDGVGQRAPDGGRLVPISWRLDADVVAGFQPVFGERQPLTVELSGKKGPSTRPPGSPRRSAATCPWTRSLTQLVEDREGAAPGL